MSRGLAVKEKKMYNILEARIEFKSNQLHRVTVLVAMSKNDVRAIFATTKPNLGYIHLSPSSDILDDKLLQLVAGNGMETVDRDEIFVNWRKKYML